MWDSDVDGVGRRGGKVKLVWGWVTDGSGTRGGKVRSVWGVEVTG